MKKGEFRKDYRVAIDTIPLPERPEERVKDILQIITPVIDQIVSDAMIVAIGTWPTPDDPRPEHRD
jgi:hypothetical protein